MMSIKNNSNYNKRQFWSYKRLNELNINTNKNKKDIKTKKSKILSVNTKKYK